MVGKSLCGVAVALSMNASAWACPTDAEPRVAGTVLTVQLPGQKAQSLSITALAALPPTTLTQRQTVASSGSSSTDRAVVYTGVLLRDVLRNAGFASATDRSARTSIVEAVASDGYRAVFSWGELFNGLAGEQAMVITAQDGKTLDVAVGPLALRSLADLRPGPRHVRNLCALIVRGP
jgi:Oxidoreductase molybdopterin binding domain